MQRHIDALETAGAKVPGAFEAYLWWYRQRAYPNDRIDWAAFGRAEDRRAAMAAAPFGTARTVHATAVPTGRWEFLGPTNLPTPYRRYYGPLDSTTSGRVNGLAFAPGLAGTYYLASASGGVWKTTDGGSAWTALSDSWRNLVTASIAVDPTNANNVWVGTGDLDGGKNAFAYGLMHSSDGGATWTNVTRNGFWGSFRRIAFNPSNPQQITAVSGTGQGTSGAIAFTSDGGATWFLAEGSGLADYAGLSYSAPFEAYGQTFRRCYVSGNSFGGTLAFSPIGDWSNTTNISRPPLSNNYQYLDVAASATDSEIVYLLSATDRTIWRGDWRATPPTAIGPVWTNVTNNFPSDLSPGDNYNWSQRDWDYHIACARDPASGGNVVYVGLIDLAASTDEGASWTSVGLSYAADALGNALALTHNDQHIMAVSPDNPAEMLVGNDGGVYGLSYNGNGSWSWSDGLSRGLGITQFYHAAFHPTDPTRMIGGTQDNASPVSQGDLANWINRGGGDGGFSAVDRFSPLIQFTNTQATIIRNGAGNQIDGSLAIYRTGNGWATSSMLPFPSPGIGAEPVAFIVPMTLDPSNPSQLYTATNHLWRWDDSSSQWTLTFNVQTLAGAGQYVTFIAVAPSDGNRIYTGSSDGRVWMTPDAGSTWTRIDSGTTSLPNRWVTGIAVDPANRDRILVTVSGTGTGHLWQCTDTLAAARTWIDRSGTGGSGLADIAADTVAIDPASPATNWYVGNDVGVFMTSDGGGSWSNATGPLGLPNVQVNRLEIVPGTGYLMAATWGRGIWRIALGTPAATFAISGHVRDGANGVAGVTVAAGGKTTATGGDGAYAFSGLSAGDYTVTATKVGYVISPGSRQVTLGPDAADVDFAATPLFTLNGTVRLAAAGLGGVEVTALTGPPAFSQKATTGADGRYTITGLPRASYSVTAAKSGYTFAASGFSNPVDLAANRSGIDFTASAVVTTFGISGHVTSGGAGVAGVTMSAGGSSAVTAADGGYSIGSLVAGPYTVTPAKTGYTFAPPQRSVTLGPDATGVSFIATPAIAGFTISGRVTSNGHGLARVSVEAAPAGVTQQPVVVGQAIPDDDADGVWSDLEVSAPGRITAVRVAVNITHPYRGDLRVGLFTPDDSFLYLFGVNAPNADDAAADLITSFPDQTPADDDLSVLAGTPAAGLWTLYVADLASEDVGTFNSWTLTIEYEGDAIAAGSTGSGGSYTITGLAAGSYAVTPRFGAQAFVPPSRTVAVGPDASAADFAAGTVRVHRRLNPR